MLTQRLGSSTQYDIGFSERLLNEMKKYPGCCDEIWVASDYGFPKLETHRLHAEELGKVAEFWRKEGYRVSLQISNTVGHGQYMQSRDCTGLVGPGTDTEHMVGADGAVAEYCFCWNGKNFRKYTVETVAAYAGAVKPHTVWLDDDVRATNHNPVRFGCFCPDCLEHFNKRHGSSFDREALVDALHQPESEWREKWVRFIRDGLSEFVYLLSSAVAKNSPGTRMGLQYCAHGAYHGYGYEFIFDAMRRATGLDPASRPGGGAYADNDPNEFISKALLIAWQNRMLPSYVREIRPEIENLPDTLFGKSAPGTALETSLYFAFGATAMSYAMVMNDYDPMEVHGRIFREFSENREYWSRLAEVNKSTSQAGLEMGVSVEYHRTLARKEDRNFEWNREPYDIGAEIYQIGLPYSIDGDTDSTVILHRNTARRMSRGELDALMKRNVITDGAVLQDLSAMGYDFSADAEEIPTGQLQEIYSDHPVNRGFEGRSWSLSFYHPTGWMIRPKRNIEILSSWEPTNQTESRRGIASAVVTTPYGSRWAVFGGPLFERTVSINRYFQILRIADTIGNPLPAILKTPCKCLLLPRKDREGKVRAVSILNRTVGYSETLELEIRKPAGKKICFMCGGEKAKDLVPDGNGDTITVSVPPIRPWSVATVFINI